MPCEKRALTLDPTPGVSRKREKYTRIACGQRPCSRCLELAVECKYYDSSPPLEKVNNPRPLSGLPGRTRRISSSSSSELGQLLMSMKKVCDDIESSTSRYHAAAIPPDSLKRNPSHNLSGPPSVNSAITPDFVHSFNLAREVLLQKGYLEDRRDHARAGKRATPSRPDLNSAETITLRAATPVLQLGHSKALEYLCIFHDHIYSAYPCIDPDVGLQRVAAVFEASSPLSTTSHALGLDLIDVEIMKVVIASAMILKGEDDHTLCRDLTDHLVWNVEVQMNEERAQLEDIIMATLLALYWTLQNQALRAWRMIGFAARACLELGLHKDRSSGEAVDETVTTSSFHKVLFSCVYDLDRRCSLFANLPWTLQDDDIDPDVLSLDDRHPFLSAMLSLNRVHTEIIRFNATVPLSGNKQRHEQAEVFDYRVQRLVENIFARGLFPTSAAVSTPPAVQDIMSSFLRLRANQIRMLAYMRYLTDVDMSFQKRQPLHILISLAVSSVDVWLGMTSAPGADVPSPLWHSLANRLLMIAVSSMFLAVSQDPGSYGSVCRRAFHTAIDSLERSAYQLTQSESEIWCSFDDLRELGEKIQMPPFDETLPIDKTFSNCSMSSMIVDSELDMPLVEPAQIYETTSQNTLPSIWNSNSFWDNGFNELELG